MRHHFNILFGGALLVVTFMSAMALAAEQDSKHPLGQPQPDKALVYMVRQGQLAGGGRTERLFVEDKVIGILPNKKYTFAYVEPGTHLLWGSFHKEPIIVDFAGGQTYFIVFKLSERISLVPEDLGSAAVAKADGFEPMSDANLKKGNKEGADKWPERRTKFAELIAVGQAERNYTPTASTEGMAKVPSSTAVSIELMENVTTATSQLGDAVWARATADVVVDGNLIIRKGAPVKAVVRSSKGKGGFGKGGLVDIAFLSVAAADGTICPLLGQMMTRGKTEGTNVASIFGGIGAAYLVKGGEGYQAAGEPATAFTKADVWIKPQTTSESMGGITGTAASQPSGQVMNATIMSPLVCDLGAAKGPGKVHVTFDGSYDLEQAKLAVVLGSDIEAPVPALAVGKDGERASADFDGWTICRFLREGQAETSFGFHLTTRDGQVLKAEGSTSLAAKKK